MSQVVQYLWLIPILPLTASGISALLPRSRRGLAAGLAIGSMVLALALSCAAFFQVLAQSGAAEAPRQWFNFRWLQFGDAWLDLGWVLDPLTAVMLVMVSLVGLLIFIYSVGYMGHDENFTRFFCFLSLFAAAMLGLVIANSLLLLFICWELVGLTSYLLIGFWYHKPSAAAAAKKAFITTRLGDLALFLGIIWLYGKTGTLVFYNAGHGCLETPALLDLATQPTQWGIAALTGIGLLILCGAIGKSGQVPLHVWLPDAMEGPTPVSALIHAATMVAAGVFLVARVYPLMSMSLLGPESVTTALRAVTWVGATTAIFAATIAVAQTDIKRILAYSTVSQLGFMMMGLGAGGVAVGMFHLITHAFFKALLFLGAGSVIHGCHEEQDVRCLGGLRRFMPVTFATYAIGMMALSGVPLFFSGFWSKDAILESAHGWHGSHAPFYLGLLAAFLTAFYMTRQVLYVFFGNCRVVLGRTTGSEQQTVAHAGLPAREHPHLELPATPQESPRLMTVPLGVLAVFSIGLGFLGTPAWPWFQSFLEGGRATLEPQRLAEHAVLLLMLMSAAIVFGGIAIGYWLYGRKPLAATDMDPLEKVWPNIFQVLRRKYYVDEAYDWTVVRLTAAAARGCDWLERWLFDGLVRLAALVVVTLSWLNRWIDEYVVNLGFDEGCLGFRLGGRWFTHWQNGKVQAYLKVIGLGLTVLLLILIWGCKAR